MKCIICGKEKPLIGVICVDCYKFPIKAPKRIEIKRCRKCGRYRVGGEWKSLSREELNDYIAGKIKADFERADINIKEKEAILYFVVKGYETKRKIRLNVDIKATVCEECSRREGNYYEAIIQLRGNRWKVERMAKKLSSMLSKHTFITKVVRLKEGIDLYVGSSKHALELLRQLSLSPKLSRKLHGLKQGKRIYRLTLAVRL